MRRDEGIPPYGVHTTPPAGCGLPALQGPRKPPAGCGYPALRTHTIPLRDVASRPTGFTQNPGGMWHPALRIHAPPGGMWHPALRGSHKTPAECCIPPYGFTQCSCGMRAYHPTDSRKTPAGCGLPALRGSHNAPAGCGHPALRGSHKPKSERRMHPETTNFRACVVCLHFLLTFFR